MTSFEDNYKAWHTNMSYIKSAFRIIGCVLAVIGWVGLPGLAIILGVAEVIGILEEFV